MVQAMININEKTNQVLNIVKAKFGLQTKSQAIDVLVEEYRDKVLEKELRPEFVKRLKRIAKEKHYPRSALPDVPRKL